MTREIDLGNGRVAVVSDEDFDLVSRYRWRATRNGKNSKTFYAVTGKGADAIWMHNLILPPGPDREVDHRDRNGLHNTRDNLRRATRSQNMANRSYTRRSPGFRGVSKKGSRWRATIATDGGQRLVGSFPNEIEAARAYDNAAFARFGEFATLNFSRDRDWLFPFEHQLPVGNRGALPGRDERPR